MIHRCYPRSPAGLKRHDCLAAFRLSTGHEKRLDLIASTRHYVSAGIASSRPDF